MPIYEYECAKCGKTIEVIQKFSDKELKKHEKCGGSLTKLISASAFQFKGTGWYVTDYARKGQSESAESSKTDSSKKDSKETSSNDKKESTTDRSATTKASKKDRSSKSGGTKD
jgi:putative FmdB family regulatory protein